LYQVQSATDDSRTDFTLSSKTTHLKLLGENLSAQFGNELRNIVVFGESEELDFAEQPVTSDNASIALAEGALTPLNGDQVALAQPVLNLAAGHRVIVSGKPMRVEVVGKIDPSALRPDENGLGLTIATGASYQLLEIPLTMTDGSVQLHLAAGDGSTGFLVAAASNFAFVPAAKDDDTMSESAVLDSIDATGTVLTFGASLQHSYDRATVVIYANVAAATQGETKQEVLGSGDASQPFQTFTLKQPPLTYTASTEPSGADSTLAVRVNDLLWHESPTFFGRGPRDRIFITRRDDDGKTTVEFGDGKTGARLPTGQENITANYRKGIGLAGNLKAGQLSLLMSRPLGVKSALNPGPASGAADGESLGDSRRNGPLTVLTLDRIVSLQDYEDFAHAFSGVGKALATWTWSGQLRGVFVTIAGPGGAEIPDGGTTQENLIAAMKSAGDPYVPLRVQNYRRAFFKMGAAIKCDPDYESSKVLAAVEQTLRDTFSFDARTFGQAVSLGEILAAIQDVPGVLAAEVSRLYRTDDPAGPALNDLLLAAAPQAGAGALPGPDDDAVAPAEMLTLSPAPLDELGTLT
jgi:predicted phage baseplate assembly protein